MHYVYSLRVWLTGRKAKSAFIEDDSGFRIGSEVKVKLEKSRFGTQGRNCAFKILWGTDAVGIQDARELARSDQGLRQSEASRRLVLLWFTRTERKSSSRALIGLKNLKTRSSKPECLKSWMNRSFVSLTPAREAPRISTT